MRKTKKKRRLDWRGWDRARAKEHAFHEDGHAVVEFLLGRADTHLMHIDMRGMRQARSDHGGVVDHYAGLVPKLIESGAMRRVGRMVVAAVGDGP